MEGSYLIIFGAIVPIFMVMALGAGVRILGWLSEETDRSLIRLIINVLVPCLILDSLIDNDALRRWDNLLLPPLIGFGFVLAGCAVSLWVALKLGATRVQAHTFAFVVGIFNYGYLPLPLTLDLFDRETLGVLFVQNVGVEIALWTVGIAFLKGSGGGLTWRDFLTPPVAAVAVGVGLNWLDATQLTPTVVLRVLEMLGQCAIPLSLLVIGATMADFRRQLGAMESVRLVVAGCLISLFAAALAGLLLAASLPVSLELKRVILLHGVMPPAVFPLLLVRREGGDVHLALQVILVGSAVSLFTVPLWLHWGMAWLTP